MNIDIAQRAGLVAGAALAGGGMVAAGLAIDAPTESKIPNGLLVGGGTALAVGGATAFISHGAVGATAGLEALRATSGTAALVGGTGALFGLAGVGAD